MKTQLTAKYLQFLTKKNKNQNAGFTLIELLVVIIIIGILSAIALPSFLNQANKAREAGAKQGVGAVNRAQQAYRLENTTFADTIDKLGIGDPSTADYTISVTTGASATAAEAKAAPKGTSDANLKTWVGCVKEASGTTSAEVKQAASCTPATPAT